MEGFPLGSSIRERSSDLNSVVPTERPAVVVLQKLMIAVAALVVLFLLLNART